MHTVRRVRQIVTVFFCLQVLDVLTTLFGLRVGATEGSFFVARLLQFGPVTGLVISKALAMCVAMAALLSNRERPVRFVNFWFVAIAGWNLVVINLALTPGL